MKTGNDFHNLLRLFLRFRSSLYPRKSAWPSEPILDHVVLVSPLNLEERKISNGKIILREGEFPSHQPSGDHQMIMGGMLETKQWFLRAIHTHYPVTVASRPGMDGKMGGCLPNLRNPLMTRITGLMNTTTTSFGQGPIALGIVEMKDLIQCRARRVIPCARTIHTTPARISVPRMHSQFLQNQEFMGSMLLRLAVAMRGCLRYLPSPAQANI